MNTPNETTLKHPTDRAHTASDGAEHSDHERQRRGQRQVRHITLGRELKCRERLRRVSAKLAEAVDDTGASALQTREWLERELREMRDDEVRELVKGFAGYAERMRGQMETLLNAVLESTARK